MAGSLAERLVLSVDVVAAMMMPFAFLLATALGDRKSVPTVGPFLALTIVIARCSSIRLKQRGKKSVCCERVSERQTRNQQFALIGQRHGLHRRDACHATPARIGLTQNDA